MEEFIGLCRKKGISVVLMSPPKYYIYNDLMKPAKLKRRNAIFEKFGQLDGVYIMNYESTWERESELYMNEDHMNPVGAKKLTIELNKRLQCIHSNQPDC